MHKPASLAFYIRKSLAHGPIRFGVSPRLAEEALHDEGGLSTGPKGEFLRKRTRTFFFAENRAVRGAELPTTAGIGATPFWKSVFDGTRRGWLFLASTILGVLFVLIGFAVIARKGAQGWVEVILGVAMIATPIIMTAQERKKIKEREERERAEREETERRHREMLASYSAALEKMRRDPSPASFEEVARERQHLELQYDIWCNPARRMVLEIGFEALARLGTARAAEVNDLMTRASTAAGLAPSDEIGVKLDLYRVVLWHLLADDRCGNAQLDELKNFRKGFDIWDRDVPVEAKAAEEFKRLQGLRTNNLPKKECTARLGFHEYCIHSTQGSVLKKVREKRDGKRVEKLVPNEPCTVFVTNKRIIVDNGKKPVEVALPKIDDIEIDMDPNVLAIRTARGIKPLDVQVEDPIYTGAIIDLAASLDERPRGFA